MLNRRGFTLVELMVTIAIIAILAVIAAPSFSSLLLKQNLNKSIQELSFVLKKARSKAALERREIVVNLNTTEVADTETQLNWKPSGQAILKSGSLTTLTFLPVGLVKDRTSDTSFIVCEKSSASFSKTISVSKMGIIQQITEGTC